MKKLINDKNGSMLLVGGILIMFVFMGLDMIFYPDNELILNEELDKELQTSEESWWDWLNPLSDFIDTVKQGLGAVYETITFQSDMMKSIAPFNVIIGSIIWIVLIIGIVDLVWIG